MKKFLVICLSVLMLFSTLLLCGFASPKQVNSEDIELYDISTDGGYVGNIYFDTSKTVIEMDSYFSTLNFTPSIPLVAFLLTNEKALVCIYVGEQNFVLTYCSVYDILNSDFSEDDFIYTSSDGWIKSTISINSPVLKSINARGITVVTVENSSFFAKTDYPRADYIFNEYSFIPPSQSGEFNIYFNVYLTVSEVYNYLSTLPYDNDMYTFFKSGNNELIAYKTDVGYSIRSRSFINGTERYSTVFSSFIGSFNFEDGSSYRFNEVGFYFYNFANNSIKFNLDINDYYISEYLNLPLFSTLPFTYTRNVSITSDILTVIKDIFISYPLILATSIINMFSNLFVTDGVLNIFGSALVTLFGIALVGSIFYIVYRIFKGKMRKRL